MRPLSTICLFLNGHDSLTSPLTAWFFCLSFHPDILFCLWRVLSDVLRILDWNSGGILRFEPVRSA